MGSDRAEESGSGRSFGGLFLAGDWDADDPPVVHHVRADEALALEHGVPAMEPQCLGNQDESIAWADLATEPHVFHPAKGDEAVLLKLHLGTQETR